MPRIKKFSPVQNLSGIQTFILDEQINSKYFRITEFKETFTGGKNGFLIEGSEFLKEGVEIKIDITDVNGDPIYYEPGDGIPEYYEGTSKLVSVYVYQDTPIGQSNITILGELKKYEDETGLVRDIPDEWNGIYNVKWQRTFNVNKNLQNEDKVRFFRRPNVTIDEIVKPVFSVNPRTKTHSGSLDGVALSPANGTNIEDYTLPTTYRIFRKSGPVFSGSMVGNPIQFDNLQYTPTIIDVVNEGELVVDTPYTQNSIVSSFTDGLYTSSFIYLEDGDELATALTASFAKIKITDMKTFVGDAARVKVFRRSQSQLTDFEFVQEIQLESNELLRDLDSKNEVELSYGLLTEQVFQNYWVTSSNDLTTQINQNVLYNSVELDSIGVNSFFTNQTFDVNENVEYTLTFSVKKSGPINEDEYIKPFLGSTPGPVIEDTSGAIPCAQAASYTGGESYPTEQTVNLGENTGPTELQYNAINVPDRFIVEWDGNVVIDSGYVGSSDYDLGGLSRSTFTSALTGEIDPITENTYPDFVTYPDDGYPRVTTQANPALPDGSGSANFNKTFSSPQLADVKVYAPLGGTAWDLTLFCPVNPPALDVERISNPDTIQEIATIRASNDLLQKFEVEENFVANNIDDVRLYFEVSGSDWYISNISLKASQETSFSPDEITFIQQVPKTLETETFEYRFEFYDINNNFIPVRVNQTKTFTGGNLNLFQKSIELIPDNLYFSFDSASNPANAIPPTVINFDVETTLVTGSINYTSQSFDLSGNLIPSSAYSAVTDVYPGLLDTTDNRAPFLTVANFTGSKDEYVVQFVRITGEVEGVSDTVIITRVEDGKGGVNFLIKPFRGTSIKNKEDKSLELQAIRIDGINEIELRSGLERNFSDAKLHLLSSSFNGVTQVETYVSLSQAITDTNFITGVSAGTTGSGEIDYNAQFNRDAIDNELIVYLMDGPTTESILTSLILNDLKDGLNNGTIEATNNTFTIKPREERIFTPVTSIVTASFYERGNTETPLTGGLVITPSMSLETKTELPEFYMFYETASFERRISLNVTDGNGNSIESGIPNVTPNVNYTPIQTKQLNVEFIYTEDVTNVQISNSETFTIVPEGLPGQDAIVIELTPNPVSVGANSKGEVSNYDLLDTTIEVKQGDLFLINTASSDPGTFTTSSITLNGIEFDRLDGNTETSMSLVGFNSMSALSASVTYDFDIYPYFTSSLITRRVVQRFNKAVDGAGAIEVLIEPINASINADESGFINADKYSILDTTLKVKQSEEFLVFDNQDLGIPGTYSASIVPNGILINEISSSSQDPNTSGDDTLHIQNFSNFVISEASASVDYNLTVYPYSLKDGVAGVPTNITRRQIFSKVNDGSAARRVKLTSNTTTIVYNADGDIETPAGSIVLTAASSNTTGSVYYRFKDESGNTLQGPITSNTYTVNDPPASGEQATYTVELLDGGTTAQVFDTDSVTIAAIQSGQSSYNVILSNASSTVEVEVDGTVNLDQTKTEIRAYKAGNELDIVDTFGTTNSGPPDFLPVVINEASASIVDYSPHITLLDDKLGEDSSNLYVTSSGLASWTNPQINRTAFITYKVDFEDGRSEQQITQTLTAVFEGATGPGLVMRGEWTGSIPYIFDLDQKRRDAVFKDINGSVHYWATTELTPTSSIYTDGDEVYTLEPVYTEGVTEEGDIDYTTTWQYLGEQDFFVAAKLAIFEESFVKNTINIGTPPPGEENAKIAIVGGTDEPYISVGQTGIQGFNQPGAFLGLSKDSSAGTTGIFSLSSNQSTAGSNLVYTGLNWDGLTLTVRGLIRQTSTSEPLGDVRGEWTAGVTYFTNDIVYYQGSSYSVISPTPITATNDTDIDTGFPPDATNSWEIAIAAGTSGTAGLDAKSLSLSADSQIFTFDDFLDTTADDDTIRIYIDQQNLSGTVGTSDVTITPTGQSPFNPASLTGTVTNGTGQQYFDITFSSTLSSDKTRLPLEISVNKDGFTDVTTIYKIEGGADSDPQYFITPLNGTQIKNSSGTLTLQAQSSDPTNGLQDLTSGDIKIYTGSVLISNIAGVTGTDYNPTIPASAISGTMNLFLSGSDGILDTITLLDVTDGLGGGTFLSPNLKTTRNPEDNSFNPTILSATASFFTPSGTEYTSSVEITPTFVTDTDFMAVSTADGDTTNITITAGDGDGGTITLGGSAVATKDTVLVATFTDPISNQTSTITETFYIISDGLDGLDALSLFLSNESHTLPAQADGTVLSFDGTGTSITLFEGTSSLSYDGVGTSNGTWTVSTNGIAITPGSITIDGDNALVGNHSTMTADSASVEYTITGKRLKGNDFTLTKTQSLTKSKQGEIGLTAKSVTVSADSQIFIFDNFGDNTAEDDTIRVYVDQQNLSGTIGTGDITITDVSSNPISTPSLTGTVVSGTGQQYFDITFSSTLSADKTKLPIQISVTKDGITDVTTIYKVEGGADSNPEYFITPLNGTQIKNSSGALTLQAQSSDPTNGLQDLTSGDIKIYSGSQTITSIAGVTGTDYNPTIPASAIFGTMQLILSGSDGVLDSLTLLDVTDGLGGGTFLSPNLKTTRNPEDNSFLPETLSATASFFTPDGTEYTSSVKITPTFVTDTDFMAVSTAVGDTTNISITAGDGDGGTITLGGSAVATKDTVLTATFTDPVTGQSTTTTETFYIISDGLDGIDALTLLLTNPSHTVSSLSDGTVTSFDGSGTTIKVFEGTSSLDYDGVGTSAGKFTISAVGDSITPGSIIEDGKFAIVGNHSSMTNDSASIEYTVTGKRLNGTDITDLSTIQTLTKAKAGTSGSNAKLLIISADSQVYSFDNFGDNTADDDTIRIYINQQNLSGEVDTGDVTITPNGVSGFSPASLSGTVSNGTGQKFFDITFSSTFGGDKTQFPAEISVTLDGITDTTTIYKIEGGADSDPQYFITPLNGTQIKNANGGIELQVQSSDPVNGLQDITTGTDARIYSGSDLLTIQTGVTDGGNGVVYNPIISASAIDGTLTLTLRSGSSGTDGILDTITLLDVTDGLGGGSFISPNLKMTRNTNNNYVPSQTSLTASFYSVNGTEYTEAVTIFPNLDGATDYMYYEAGTSPHDDSGNNISIIVDNGDGTSYSGTGIGNKLATKDIVVTATFTDPVNSQTNTIVETVYIVSDGVDGIDGLTITNTNQSHTFPASSAGQVSSYTNSGTTIKVFEGNTQLDYDGTGTTPGHFSASVVATPSDKITIGSFTDSGNDLVVGNHSSMDDLTDLITLTYSIEGQRLNGDAFTIQTNQTLTKAKAGTDGVASYVTRLSADNFVITYDQDGLNPSPSSIKLIASSSNFTDAYFKFTGDGGFSDDASFTDGDTANTDERTFTVPSSYSTTPYKFRVGVADGDQIERASDNISIASVKPGSDTTPQYFITSIAGGTQIKNSSGGIELQVKKSSTSGLEDVTSGTDARIYSASTLLTVQTGVTDGGNGVVYNPIISASAINGTLTLTLQSGSSGTDGILDTITLIDVSDGLGGGTFLSPNLKTTRDPSDNSFNPTNLSATASFFTPDGTEYTSSVTITPSFDSGDKMAVSNAVGDTTNISITAGDGDGGTITLGGSPVATKDTVLVATFTDPNSGQTSTITETFYIISDGADGIDAITVINTNQSHTMPASSSGEVLDYTNSGTTIQLYEGATQLNYDKSGVASGTFSASAVVSPVGAVTLAAFFDDQGDDFDVNDHTAMANDEDVATITYTLTGKRFNGDGFSVDTTQTITKSKAGITGQSGQTGASLNIIFIRSATQPSTPSPSSGIPAGWSDSPPAGTDLLWASQGTKGVGETNFTWGTPYQVEGSAVVEIAIYILVTSGNPAPSTPTGGSFNFTTSTLNPPSGWSTSVPTLSSDGDKVYLANGLFSGAPTQTAATTTWTSPIIYAQRTDGVNGTSGTDGAAGSAGGPGPGLVYRGEYDSGETYYHTDTRRDIVEYSSNYYLTNNVAKSGTATWGTPPTDWEAFGAQFDSVATDILFSQDVYANRTINVGASGSTPVISLDSDFSNANANPYIGIGASAYDANGIFLGYDTTIPKLSLKSGTDSLLWDGTNLTVNGTVNVAGGNAATQADVSTAADNASLSGSLAADNALLSSSLADLDLQLTSGMIIENGRELEKISGGSSWNQSVYSGVSYKDGAYVVFKANKGLGYAQMGLSDNPTSDSGQSSLDYAWKVNNTTLEIRKNGNLVTPDVTLPTPAGQEALKITYDGDKIRFFVDETLYHTETTTANREFYLDSTFYTQAKIITWFDFGAYGQTNSSEKSTGKVGGWTITSSEIQGGSPSGGGDGSNTTQGIRLGATGYISAKNFYLDTTGNANFSGTVTATAGEIAGFSIVGNTLDGNSNAIVLDANNSAITLDDGTNRLDMRTGNITATSQSANITTFSNVMLNNVTYSGIGQAAAETNRTNFTITSDGQYTGNITISQATTDIDPSTSPAAEGNVQVYTGVRIRRGNSSTGTIVYDSAFPAVVWESGDPLQSSTDTRTQTANITNTGTNTYYVNQYYVVDYFVQTGNVQVTANAKITSTQTISLGQDVVELTTGGIQVTSASDEYVRMQKGASYKIDVYGNIRIKNNINEARMYILDSNDDGILWGLDSSGNFFMAPVDAGSNEFTRELKFIQSTETWQFDYDVDVNGTLSKGGGSFKIPHPLSELSGSTSLIHSFIEGPQADLIYRGKILLTSGSAQINLDSESKMTEGTFEALNTNVQCFTSNETSWNAVRGYVNGNILTIECENTASSDEISWMVIGERDDDTIKKLSMTDENGRVKVEVPNTSTEKNR